MNAVSHSQDFSLSPSRAWTGPALLLACAAQFVLGAAVLADFPARPMNFIGDFGLLLVMTSPLTFIAGLGECFNWLARRFSPRES